MRSEGAHPHGRGRLYGARSNGWVRFLKVEPLRCFEVEDGFAHEDGRRNTEMPSMRMIFGFEGELLESVPPYRAVTTELMIGVPGPATRNEMTLTAVPAGTLLALLITYPNKELRDMILGTGMTQGMEASYARLEQGVLGAA